MIFPRHRIHSRRAALESAQMSSSPSERLQHFRLAERLMPLWLKHVAFLVAPGIPQRYPRIKELLCFCKYKETGFEICVNHVGFQPFAFLQKSADLVVNWNREQSLLWWPVYSTGWSFSGHPFAWPDLYSRCFRTCGHHGPPLVWGHLSDKWKLSMFPWRQNTRVKI